MRTDRISTEAGGGVTFTGGLRLPSGTRSRNWSQMAAGFWRTDLRSLRTLGTMRPGLGEPATPTGSASRDVVAALCCVISHRVRHKDDENFRGNGRQLRW